MSPPDVAEAEPREASGRHYLLVNRHDRQTYAGMPIRIHQKDACQALGIASERKYAAEGGPASRDLFALTRAYVRTPAIERSSAAVPGPDDFRRRTALRAAAIRRTLAR